MTALWRRLRNWRALKAIKRVALALIGLTLVGSSFGACDNMDRGELLYLAKEHSAMIWSKDGSKVVFGHPPQWGIRSRGRRLAHMVPSPGHPTGDFRRSRQLLTVAVTRRHSCGIRCH